MRDSSQAAGSRGTAIMRGITLHRPWDQAILYGSKRIENRSWVLPLKYWNQVIALHAGKKYDSDSLFTIVKNGYNPPSENESPIGIVGAFIVDKVIIHDETVSDPWFFGPYGWHIRKVFAFSKDKIIKYRGKQGLWIVEKEIEEIIWSIIGDIDEKNNM